MSVFLGGCENAQNSATSESTDDADPVAVAPVATEVEAPPANESESETDHGHHTPQKKHPANRLESETSPYLLLHAHNPVDWYPWGEEAFAKAKKENKPIWLAGGYCGCPW